MTLSSGAVSPTSGAVSLGSEAASLSAVAAPIAREAGALLRDYWKRGVRTEYKGDVDLVTEADRASERLIRTRLAAALPAHGIFGEEGTREGLDRAYRWYVDPLDGTTNFAHGFPVFCVVLGCEHRVPGLAEDADGELVAGVVYDPLRDELFAADLGQGATLNGEPIYVSKTRRLDESLTATGFPSQKRHSSPNVHLYHELTLRSHGVRRAGSAALDLAYVAAGRLDGYWEFNLNPWDTSAGALLVREAGGVISRFDGSPFRLDSAEVLAANPAIHPEMREVFAALFAGRGLAPIPTPAEFARRRREAAADAAPDRPA